MEPFRIFIGYDPREAIAYHVLAHSILTRATVPVTIAPLRRELLRDAGFKRKRGPLDSTEFAISRFMVPALCEFEGFALFLDCDMLVLGDVAELYQRALTNAVLSEWAVACVQHRYAPKKATKFLNQGQTIYPQKNWSSVMLFDCRECKVLTPAFVNRAHGLDLHQFKWLDAKQKIEALPPEWNNLIGEECELPVTESKLLHYTRGGPWFREYDLAGEAYNRWRDEQVDMLAPLPEWQ